MSALRTGQGTIDAQGEVRERRADEAGADSSCAHRTCWVEEAHVAELTSLLGEGPDGDQLEAWPATKHDPDAPERQPSTSVKGQG